MFPQIEIRERNQTESTSPSQMDRNYPRLPPMNLTHILSQQEEEKNFPIATPRRMGSEEDIEMEDVDSTGNRGDSQKMSIRNLIE